MNQRQLETRLAKEQRITKKQSKQILDSLKGIFEQVLATGDKVSLKDFGYLERYLQDAREFRDPNSGGKVWKEAHWKVRFVPYKQLREAIN